MDEDIIKFHFGSDYRNPKLYGVSEPQLIGFLSRDAVSIYPDAIETLRRKGAVN